MTESEALFFAALDDAKTLGEFLRIIRDRVFPKPDVIIKPIPYTPLYGYVSPSQDQINAMMQGMQNTQNGYLGQALGGGLSAQAQMQNQLTIAQLQANALNGANWAAALLGGLHGR